MGMTVNLKDHQPDPAGLTTGNLSMMATLYPATNITVDSYRIGDFWCGGGEGRNAYTALSSLSPSAMAATYDVVLIDFDPSCVLDPVTFEHAMLSRWYAQSGSHGQDAADAFGDELLAHPLSASYTQDPTRGPALAFDADGAARGQPLGWGGAGGPMNPYHDASDLITTAKWDAYWNYFQRVKGLLDGLRAAGLPVVVPAGDHGVGQTRRHNWQSVGGIAALDSVITVGAAATSPASTDPNNWIVAPQSSTGITFLGTVKPDLLAPGYPTFAVSRSSALYQWSCGGGVASWVPMTCGGSLNGYLPYQPNDSADFGTISVPPGIASSHFAAGLVALEVAYLRHAWPGGWPSGQDMTGVIRSLLQARSTKLAGPQADGLPAAPFEQGAGVLQGAVRPQDVSSYPLLRGQLNLPPSALNCVSKASCPTPVSAGTYPGGPAITGVSTRTASLLGVDLSGMAFKAAISPGPSPGITCDPTQDQCSITDGTEYSSISASSSCDSSGTCTVTESVGADVPFAGADCGWVQIAYSGQPANSPPLSFPTCSLRPIPNIRIHAYYPQYRDLQNVIVALDLYNPYYKYVDTPFGVSLTAPPSVTVYEDDTDANGNGYLNNVAPGIYQYKPYFGYEMPGYRGTRARDPSTGQALAPQYTESTSDTVPYHDFGELTNYEHEPPIVVPSAIPCSSAPSWVQQAMLTNPLIPPCTPAPAAWHPRTETWPDGTSGHSTAPDGTVLHDSGYWDDTNSICAFPLSVGATTLKSVDVLCGADINSLALDTLIGVGFSSHRVKNLWPQDFDLGLCQYGSLQGAMELATVNTCHQAQDNNWSWTVGAAINASYTFPPTILNQTTGTNQTITLPVGIAHHRFAIPDTNYDTFLDLAMSFALTNAAVEVTVTAGESTHTALFAAAGYDFTYHQWYPGTWGPVDPRWNAATMFQWCNDCYSQYNGRQMARWYFRTVGADHGDIYITIVPTALGGVAKATVSQIGYSLDTFDKVNVRRVSDAYGDRLNEFAFPVNPRLTTAEVQNPTCTDVFGCDDMRLYFETPKGPPWEGPYLDSTCTKDDVTTRVTTSPTGILAVNGANQYTASDGGLATVGFQAWDPDPGGTLNSIPVQDLEVMGRDVLSTDGTPLLASYDSKLVENHWQGVASIPWAQLSQAALAGQDALTVFFGPYRGACPTTAPTQNYGTHLNGLADAVSNCGAGFQPDPLDPVAPYSTSPPVYCGYYTIEPTMAAVGFTTSFGTGVLPPTLTSLQCPFVYWHMTGEYWDTWLARQMQQSC